ncbi:MAG: malto-oligosyltrehalose trehalohydrolase [Deltaproteobacteria bacterium]|nr:malto-oligosyltrehalose trehalohydrolase [Deltaproteobacteria bacterium]MBZ0219467.1 malto-oligosyltrehalose trehalohydrolase [Deltaproteobacteria bacterium]
MEIGANIEGAGCRFTVWAPEASVLCLVIQAAGEDSWRAVQMERDGSGYWSALVPGAGAGSRYRFSPDGRERADPASHYQPLGVKGPSEVVDHASFQWDDGAWKAPSPADMVIYEVHPGTFTREGDLLSIIPRLASLRDLGVNALELMPVAQFPGERNWGYDGVFPFSVQNTYGGPDALKRLVNECHSQGMAVILDVVYNHFGPEGNYIGEFGPYFTDRYRTPWGDAVNFDGRGSDHVREFFIKNALHWFERYHIDALRLDAIHAIIDMSANPFLRALRDRVAEYSSGKGRAFLLFAESDLNDTRAVSKGEYGLGLDALWSDDFHHSVHALITGERGGYYADFGEVRHLAKAMNDGFTYSGQYSAYRGRSFGSPSAGVPKDRFIVSVQNHDQVGNRMLGDRLSRLASFEGLKLAAGLLLLSPYVPLLFMGEEYGEEAPFLYFIDHRGKELVRAVREGRKKEFEAFKWDADPPDPASIETFLESKIDWEKRGAGRQKTLLELYRTLIMLRREFPALAAGGTVRATALEDEKTMLLSREAKGERVFAVFNFSRDEARIRRPLTEGRWARVLDSSCKEWDGPGSLLPASMEAGVTDGDFVLHPESFVLYAKEGR